MATSQNGWSVYPSAPSATIPWITGRIRPGDVATVFDYLGKRFNAEVEPIRKDWSWGWAYRAIRGASSGYSNHASGTAVDFNAPAHGLGVRGTFSAKQVTAIHTILKDLDGVIRWGGDYENRVDSMHFEVNANAAAVARVAAKIRAGKVGGSAPAAPAPASWKWNPDVVSDLAIIQNQFHIAQGAAKGEIKRYHGVAAIQNALNVKAGEKLAVDGLCGAATVAAWKRWETKHPGTGWKSTPDMVSLKALGIAYRFEAPAPKPKPTPAPAPAKVTLSVMTWNVENKGDHVADVAELKKILAEHKPDVVCLQEAYRLDLSGIPGYREVYHASKGYPSGSENPAQAILVRDGVTVKDKKPLVMHLPWFGPKLGIKHDPRIHRYVDVVKGGKSASVSTWHVPFGKEQVEETRRALVAWLKKAGVRVAVADLNGLAGDTVGKVGTPAGAKVDGSGLDKVMFKLARLVKSVNLGKRGRSDHPVKIWIFEI